ncbi:lytic murein transglycosylase [Pararhodobacter zhoushanensis]|uniref:Lytic murein transglycosylase n=1 Tax=Pararhodobacter zhoushanensis TaxID=2479545 RepID=A0ABT3GUZ7_9RHOB|nr:lytic murein transglycosylase [Pararhodobacter zhoushanensis]MCW1931363.1 lytic murein transglycosylase [Pararhodobacter zhoushanensis]
MQIRAGLFWLSAALSLTALTAAAVERSPRPVARPSLIAEPVVAQLVQARANDPAVQALAPDSSRRPAARPRTLASAPAPVAASGEFGAWLRGFRTRALREGISARVFDAAFAGVRPDTSTLRHETSQPEFSRPIWAYLDSAVSESRIRNGQAALRDHRRVLDEIEARYDVEREVIVAVWGMESAYGALRGSTRIIPALSALAMGSRRADFYEQQLIGALRIIQSGDVDASHMVGSWAGAMGHTQFIPTSYLAYAVDFRGDGVRDIWSDDPTDSLASTAAYLASHGWQRGQPWGVEVVIPRNFNPRLANTSRDAGEWRSLGIEPVRGATLPRSGEATLLFPAGSRGPAILAFQNFRVIKRYNNADAYAIAIGHLADRLRGGGGFVGDWPRDDRPLSLAEREELQRVLARSGHYDGTIDGRVGQGTLAAVREWQSANGLPPDGYVSLALLQRMRR